jgi:hypothetical protein
MLPYQQSSCPKDVEPLHQRPEKLAKATAKPAKEKEPDGITVRLLVHPKGTMEVVRPTAKPHASSLKAQ